MDRTGYSSSSAIAIIIQGSGRKDAWSFDGSAAKAPEIYVTYTAPPAQAYSELEQIQKEIPVLAMEVFPNPLSDYSQVRFMMESLELEEHSLSLNVYTLTGRLVQSRSLNIQTNEPQLFSLDSQQLENGIYLIEIRNKKGESLGIEKVVKH